MDLPIIHVPLWVIIATISVIGSFIYAGLAGVAFAVLWRRSSPQARHYDSEFIYMGAAIWPLVLPIYTLCCIAGIVASEILRRTPEQ